MRYITPLKAAEGLGASHTGTQQHWMLTVTAVALAVLTPFFLWAVGGAIGLDHPGVVAHFSRPFPSVVTGLFIVIGLLHFILGTRIMIDDYLKGGARKLAIIASVALSWLVIAVTVFALAKLVLN
ncbi:succinate dehydrogenase, hydrophobic membrane anchor protein [Paracoccus pacificus]|uniref:Succinate dehydrogenase hydrophobic membrane anchor subunit n=1 Tax=Paracoccus pacificus TaxID=1463598 RepID=A0ABW4R7L2_9RHOB